MDQFNVHQPKKLYNSDNVKSKESTQNTPYIPAMHQEQKDSVSFSGGNRPASAEKASDAVLLGFSRLMQGFEGQTFNSELNKILKNSIETLKQSNIFEDYDGAEKNIDNFIQVYFESFVIDSEVAAQTALEGGLKNVLKDDKELSIMLLINLSDKISINSDKKESKAAYTLINKIAQLPDNEIDEKVKKYANFKANAIDLSLKVKNENYGGIIQSAIKLCKIDYGTDKTKIQTVISRISKLIKNEEKGLQLVNTITQYIKSNPNSDDASICKLILQKISTLDERENKVNGAVKYKARNKLNELETQNEVKVPNKLASLDTVLNAKPFNKDKVISTTLDIVKKEPEMVNDVVGKISSFLISNKDINMTAQLMKELFNNITSNATSDEGLNALESILRAFIKLPKKNTNSEIEARSEVFLRRLKLFKLINDKNSSIEDILNAGIDYMKYQHPQYSIGKPLKEFIPLLKNDDKGPLFIEALYGKACEKGSPLTKGLYDDDRAKKTMQDDLKVVRSLFEKIYELLLFEDIQISENVRNIFENAYIACLNGNYDLQKISTLDEGNEDEVNGAVKYEARNKLKELETQNEVKVPNKLASLDTVLNAKPFNKDKVISTTLDIVKKEPEMVNDVVGKINSFLISKKDSRMATKFFYGLFNKITSNATSDEGLLNALGLILQAFIHLPKENTNSAIEAWSEVFLRRLKLFKLINNKNSSIEDILNAGIDYMKYQHPQYSIGKPLKEFIPLLKNDDKGPLFIEALYGKACEKGSPLTKGLYDDDRAKKTMQDDLKVVRSLFEKIYELLLFEDIQISENVRNIFENARIACLSGNYELTFPNQQEKVPQDISAKIMNVKEGCALVKDLAKKSLQNDIEANKTLEQISRLPDSEVNKKVKQYALMCLQNETLEKELKKGKECNMSNLVDNALSIASSNNVNYKMIFNKFITFIQNNEKKDTNQPLNNKLFSNLYKKSKCYPPTNESTAALSLLKSLESQQNGVISESSKNKIKKFIALSNLYNLANNPGTKMEEIVNNMLESKAFLKEQHNAGIDYLILQQVQNILTDVNKGHELIKILFEKAKNPQQQQDVMEFLLDMLNCESPGEINENVKKTAQNAYMAISHKQEQYKVSMP